MLFEHLDTLAANDLLVLDRSYPAHWLAAVLSQRRIHFCVRLIRVVTPNGKVHVLIDTPSTSSNVKRPLRTSEPRYQLENIRC